LGCRGRTVREVEAKFGHAGFKEQDATRMVAVVFGWKLKVMVHGSFFGLVIVYRMGMSEQE